MRLIVHGGAGGEPEEPAARQAALEAAAEAGIQDGSPTDAVCAAVRVLEADSRFNAGVGGAVQADGRVRTDAGLMTDDRSVGAACSMPGVAHAVDVARAVKEETPHVMLAGVHAVDLAAAVGVETEVDLLTDRTRARWEELESRPTEGVDPLEQATWVREHFGRDTREGGGGVADGEPDADGDGGPDTDGDGGPDPETTAGVDRSGDHDTVGAVATDGDRVAAATSTGGRWLAMAGRVGDVPQVGSGFYCTPAGGASATGAGEDIARTTLARRAVQHLVDGLDADAAAGAAIDEFGDLVEGTAGVVVLTPDGDGGSAYDSETMQTATAGRTP